MPELPHRAGLAQDSAVVGVGEECHEVEGQMAAPGQPDAGETHASPRRGEPEREPDRDCTGAILAQGVPGVCRTPGT